MVQNINKGRSDRNEEHYNYISELNLPIKTDIQLVEAEKKLSENLLLRTAMVSLLIRNLTFLKLNKKKLLFMFVLVEKFAKHWWT